jgi:iron complex transport system ATP-binding protein
VTLKARPLTDWSARALAQQRAVLPQHSELAFRFSALEVVRMGRLPFDEPAAKTDRIAREALIEVGMASMASRDWMTLSGGERQRVQLARVLAQIRDVPDALLFLDEPTNHLDLTHQLHVLERARSRVEEGLTVVAVLHDLSYAARMADVAVVMKDGRVVAAGAPGETLVPSVLEGVFGVRLRQVPVDEGFVLIPG